MRKRGVELSMNVIIIAAIALIVLVLLVLLVTNATKNIQNGTACAQLNRGQCVSLGTGEGCADALGDGYTSAARDCPSEQTCCFQP